MTLEKAIETIKTEKKCVMRNISIACERNCYDCDLLLPDEQILTGYDMAIAALEKQIPKKPIWYEGYPYCVCDNILYSSDKHCNKCGQAILWESD